MKFKSILLGLSIIVGLASCKDNKQDYTWLKKAINISEYQLEKSAEKFEASKLIPRTLTKDGKVHLVKARDWTSGFFPGSLWYIYEISGNKNLKKYALIYTHLLKNIQFCTETHDVGFMINCSYGNSYRLTKSEIDKQIIIQTAKSLATRFNAKVGAIRSWSFGKWEFPVIVDNMMNLELLFDASRFSGDKIYKEIAIKHANTTLKNHFRDDYSSYHVVSYDTLTGAVLSKGTHQGISDESAWSRGQAWAIYGYTVCYRETKDPKYLALAEHIAAYIMNQKNITTDLIPYWDYDADNIPNAERDASAATITASALLELQKYSPKKSKEYIAFAETIIKNLSSDNYLAKKDGNNLFVLKHSVGAHPYNKEVDVPLNYADYYYLEAIKRYIKLKNIKF